MAYLVYCKGCGSLIGDQRNTHITHCNNCDPRYVALRERCEALEEELNDKSRRYKSIVERIATERDEDRILKFRYAVEAESALAAESAALEKIAKFQGLLENHRREGAGDSKFEELEEDHE